MKRGRKVLVGFGVLVAVVVLALLIAGFVASEPMPKGGASGEGADALAHRLEKAMNKEAWDRTGAVEWYHAHRTRHLWDRTRNFDRVAWKQYEVLLDIGREDGIATKDGTRLSGKEKDEAVRKAYRLWANDSFWLNPLAKLFDDGVTREQVQVPERDRAMADTGLLVRYTSGGVTPGDAYLWLVPKDGMPPAWRMWVSIIPVKGLEVTWDGWQPIQTGAMISRTHKLSALSVDLDDVRGAATLLELTSGKDPFAPLATLE